jgi:hypothetical protein
MFVYRPCLALHIEELCIFGTLGNVPPGQTSAGGSMAYDVVYRAEEHIQTSLQGTHHLLYGTASMLSRVDGLGDFVDMSRVNDKAVGEDGEPCRNWCGTSNTQDLSRCGQCCGVHHHVCVFVV